MIIIIGETGDIINFDKVAHLKSVDNPDGSSSLFFYSEANNPIYPFFIILYKNKEMASEAKKIIATNISVGSKSCTIPMGYYG